MNRFSQLWFCTLTFGWCFAVWTLYAFAGLHWQAQWQLSATELGLLLASPIFSAALLRFAAGYAMTRIEPQRLWHWLLLLQTPPLLLLSYAESYQAHVWLGLWLGVAGVSFTLGSQLVLDGVPEQQRGVALGIFGMGNAGAVISLLLVSYHQALGLSMAQLYQALAAANVGVWLLFRWRLPPRTPPVTPATARSRLWQDPRIWRFSLYYYFVFGCFLALLMWLPHYYMTAYQRSAPQALGFTLLFVTTSSMVRGFGGWLSARVGGRTVNWSVFWICLICLFFLSYPPTDFVISGIHKQVQLHIEIGLWPFTVLLCIIGIAQGLGRASVYSLLYHYYPDQFAKASGIVSAAGTVGGFTLPVLFGLAQDIVGIYSASFMLLYGVLAGCMMLMFLANQREQFQRELARARADNFLHDPD